MSSTKRRWMILIITSSGTLLISTCDLVMQTIAAALGIVDIWV